MSRTIKGSKDCSHEFWGRRHTKLRQPGKFTKDQTHRLERRKGKSETEKRGDRDAV